MPSPDLAPRLAKARFRAWHRGTREADYMIGGYFDAFHTGWDEPALAWFEALVDQDDVDVMAWALGSQPVPAAFAGPMMARMQALDYVNIPR